MTWNYCEAHGEHERADVACEGSVTKDARWEAMNEVPKAESPKPWRQMELCT